MIVFVTGVLLVKAHTHDNLRLLSYQDNGFCNMIITLSILLHITKHKLNNRPVPIILENLPIIFFKIFAYYSFVLSLLNQLSYAVKFIASVGYFILTGKPPSPMASLYASVTWA